jgi:hypothetical protein
MKKFFIVSIMLSLLAITCFNDQQTAVANPSNIEMPTFIDNTSMHLALLPIPVPVDPLQVGLMDDPPTGGVVCGTDANGRCVCCQTKCSAGYCCWSC